MPSRRWPKKAPDRPTESQWPEWWSDRTSGSAPLLGLCKAVRTRDVDAGANASVWDVHIRGLEIRNFKAVTFLKLEDLRNAVVIAGPNGCGKSCVLDAIRLLKSVYGGYQANEWHSWMGEFQINFNQRPGELLRLFQDRERELLISASFSFSKAELDYVNENAAELIRAAVWREVVPELAGWRALVTTPLASQYRAHSDEVEQRAKLAANELRNELASGTVTATLRVSPRGCGQD